MKITLSEEHVKVILSALEAFSRMRIGQFRVALEEVFPKECWDLGWDKMQELERPLKAVFFPNDPPNGGPGICSEQAGDGRIAYEIQKTIQQYRALKKSGGWFGSGYDFDGNLLNPSGLPPPKIEGLEEMQYMDFLVPEEYQDAVHVFMELKDYKRLWHAIDKALPNLPRGDKAEIIVKYIKETPNRIDYKDSTYVRVHKPRKSLDGLTF